MKLIISPDLSKRDIDVLKAVDTQDELLDLRKEMMKTYDNNYKANESKFNEIKESYQ